MSETGLMHELRRTCDLIVRRFPRHRDEVGGFVAELRATVVSAGLTRAVVGLLVGTLYSLWIIVGAAVTSGLMEPSRLYLDLALAPLGLGWLVWPMVGIVVAVDRYRRQGSWVAVAVGIHYLTFALRLVGSEVEPRPVSYAAVAPALIVPYLAGQIALWVWILLGPRPAPAVVTTSCAARRPSPAYRVVEIAAIILSMLVTAGALVLVARLENPYVPVTGHPFALTRGLLPVVALAVLVVILARCFLARWVSLVAAILAAVVVPLLAATSLHQAGRDLEATDIALELVRVSIAGNADPQDLAALEAGLDGVWRPVVAAAANLRSEISPVSTSAALGGLIGHLDGGGLRDYQRVARAQRMVDELRRVVAAEGRPAERAVERFKEDVASRNLPPGVEESVWRVAEVTLEHRQVRERELRREQTRCLDALSGALVALATTGGSSAFIQDRVRFVDSEQRRRYAGCRSTIVACARRDPTTFSDIASALPVASSW